MMNDEQGMLNVEVIVRAFYFVIRHSLFVIHYSFSLFHYNPLGQFS